MSITVNVATKSEAMYKILKQELLSGEIRGGQRMVIADLASKHNVSPMPVREAINRLQQEGWVDVVPHFGAVVKNIDIEKFTEIVEVRNQLEILAVMTAIPRMTPRAIQKLENIIEKMETTIGSTTMHKFMALDRKFHFAIYDNSPNVFLIENVSSLWERTSISQYIFAWDASRAVESHKEHKDILAAIVKKEPLLAGELLKQHKEKSLGRLMIVLNPK